MAKDDSMLTPAQLYQREWYQRNKEAVKARSREWSAANKDRKRAADKAYREANKDRLTAMTVERNRRNPNRKAIYTKSRSVNIDAYRAREAEYRAKNREACNERIRQWKQANPHKLTHYFHKRRGALLKALPIWANLEAIEAVYAESQRLQELTGTPHHVDHIVPLLSPLVCGLHCEANLRVVPAADNLTKSNRWWPDKP